jgi:hypothetical protein
MRFRILSTALAVIFLLSYQLVPSSAFIGLLSIEEMTEAADVILIGTVEEVLHSAASPYTVPKMHRQVTVSVERYLKNKLETKTVTVIILGATVGNSSIWMSDQPNFKKSERVLLFLQDDLWFLDENPQGYYQVVGLVQGKFIVGSDSAVSSGHVIEDGLKVGAIKFKLGERSAFENLVFPGVVALLGLVVVFLFYRLRVSR